MLAVTEGGPFYATTTPALYLYFSAFGRGHWLEPIYGQASAVATILFFSYPDLFLAGTSVPAKSIRS